MIQKIYVETRNPSIDFLTSKTNKTSYEVINGYKLPYMTYLDKVFVNNDDGISIIDKPLIFMADFKCEMNDRFKKLLSYLELKGKEEQRKVVIIYPYYDRYALDFLKRKIMQEYSAYGLITMTFGRVGLTNNMDDMLYNDFSIMAGGSIIKESDIPDDMTDADMFKLVDSSLGRVDKLMMCPDSTTIYGFTSRNEAMYNAILHEARDTYKEFLDRDMKRNSVTTETFNMKRRVSRLSGKMGIIHIGGPSELAKEANKDLIEDAVKACESAFNYGYNVGSGFAIMRVISNIDENETTSLEKLIYSLIFQTFLDVFYIIVHHKYPDQDDDTLVKTIRPIIEAVLTDTTNKGFDIVKEEKSDSIINPCYTDIEVLKATASLVGMIVSSNQYISITIREPASNE
jgi:chaperonin GroEL (HSP60 family)